MNFPWEQPPPEPEYDPFQFIRLRIQHGDAVKFVGIRADDTDITGKIMLDNDTAIVVSVWGVPSKSEVFMTAKEVATEIVNYVKQQGLNPR